TFAKTYAAGGDMNIEAIYAEIVREDTNWADNPAVNLIPKSMNNSILNPQATAWHKIIMANINPKTHGTKFDMKHALLIYVLITEGAVNLLRIMRDILLVRPTKHPRHLLPFPVFITRLANCYEVPEFPNDKFHTIRPVDMYVPYGDWRGEKARAPARQRRQPPPQVQQDEQQLPPEPEHRPSTSATHSAPAQYSLEPTLHDIMRRFDLQDRQIARTQAMIRRAFPQTDFTGLGFSSSSGDNESDTLRSWQVHRIVQVIPR
ncbi:hypothetical protein PIB30_076440, partial [Stylosanthes scabra]|nr:hypothetical protein [Stylosanthes scabra]